MPVKHSGRSQQKTSQPDTAFSRGKIGNGGIELRVEEGQKIFKKFRGYWSSGAAVKLGNAYQLKVWKRRGKCLEWTFHLEASFP